MKIVTQRQTLLGVNPVAAIEMLHTVDIAGAGNIIAVVTERNEQFHYKDLQKYGLASEAAAYVIWLVDNFGALLKNYNTPSHLDIAIVAELKTRGFKA